MKTKFAERTSKEIMNKSLAFATETTTTKTSRIDLKS